MYKRQRKRNSNVLSKFLFYSNVIKSSNIEVKKNVSVEEQPYKTFFISKRLERSLFATSASACDATATITPLSLILSTISANSLKSFDLWKSKEL